jgi:hypothetical protein
MNASKYTGSVSRRIKQLFAEADRKATQETVAFYKVLAKDAGTSFELATEACKRHGLKACDFINFADALTHVGVFERRVTPTFNKNGIANGCTFEFRRAQVAA